MNDCRVTKSWEKMGVPHGDAKFSKSLTYLLPMFICSMLACLQFSNFLMNIIKILDYETLYFGKVLFFTFQVDFPQITSFIGMLQSFLDTLKVIDLWTCVTNF